VSLWNAAAAGMRADEIASALEELSRYPVPQAVLVDVRDLCARYGRLRLTAGDGTGALRLVADDAALPAEVTRAPSVAELGLDRGDGRRGGPRAAQAGARRAGLAGT